MAKKKKISEQEWKAANVKPEIPLDVQQSIMGIEPAKTKAEKLPKAAKKPSMPKK